MIKGTGLLAKLSCTCVPLHGFYRPGILALLSCIGLYSTLCTVQYVCPYCSSSSTLLVLFLSTPIAPLDRTVLQNKSCCHVCTGFVLFRIAIHACTCSVLLCIAIHACTGSVLLCTAIHACTVLHSNLCLYWLFTVLHNTLCMY